MGAKLEAIDARLRHYRIFAILHVIILLASVFLVLCISWDTFKNLQFYRQPQFLTMQFWICMLFLADFFAELFLSPNKLHFFATRWVFLIVSVPWLAIFSWCHCYFHPQVEYVLQFIPLVRGGYALAIVVGWFTSSRISSLFFSYLITLVASIYFASLAFYLFEYRVNNLVTNYYDALWWAFMDATTVGSNIVAITAVGRVLSVILAALGMMMFPIFTVYVTNKITAKHSRRIGLSSLGLGGEIPDNESATGNGNKEGDV